MPLGDAGEILDEGIVESYLDGAVAVLDEHTVEPDGAGELVVAYTRDARRRRGACLTAAFDRAGFAAAGERARAGRARPGLPHGGLPQPGGARGDGPAARLAAAIGADIAIANDPDADRCAVAIPRGGGGWRMLRGDEVGVLLADHLMRRGVQRPLRHHDRVVLAAAARCARRAASEYAETLTGFKWIVRAGGPAAERLVYGYEEALGYCVAPAHVRDKDGITAALLVAELAAGLKASCARSPTGSTSWPCEFGVYATDQLSVRVDDLSAIARAMADPAAPAGRAARRAGDGARGPAARGRCA